MTFLTLTIHSVGREFSFEFPERCDRAITIGGGRADFSLPEPIPKAVVCFIERLGDELTVQPAQELPMRLNGVQLTHAARLRPESELVIGTLRIQLRVTASERSGYEALSPTGTLSHEDAPTSLGETISSADLEARTHIIPKLEESDLRALQGNRTLAQGNQSGTRSHSHSPPAPGPLSTSEAVESLAKTEIFGSMTFDEETNLDEQSLAAAPEPRQAPIVTRAASHSETSTEERATAPLRIPSGSYESDRTSESPETEIIAPLKVPDDVPHVLAAKHVTSAEGPPRTDSTEVLEVKDQFREARVDWRHPNPRRSPQSADSPDPSRNKSSPRKPKLPPARTILLASATVVMLGFAAFSVINPPSEEPLSDRAVSLDAARTTAPEVSASTPQEPVATGSTSPMAPPAMTGSSPQQPQLVKSSKGTTSVAVDALFQGRYAEALAQYRDLANQFPQDPSYERLVRYLEKRTSPVCSNTPSPGCPEVRQ